MAGVSRGGEALGRKEGRKERCEGTWQSVLAMCECDKDHVFYDMDKRIGPA